MSKKNNPKQYFTIDLVKLIMAIFVIAIHTHPFENIKPGVFMTIYNTVVSCAVPFFFISSGFLIFEKTNKSEEIKNLSTYLKKIIKLYIIWTLIYLPLTIYGLINNDRSSISDIFEFIRGFFIIGENYNSWMLWYLLSMIYSLVLIIILLKNKFNLKNIYILSVLLFIIAEIITIYTQKIDLTPVFIQKPLEYFKFIFINGRLFIGMFYIMTGAIISKYKKKYFTFIYIGLILLIANLLINELFSYTYIAIFSIIIFLITLTINFKESLIFKKLREASTIFYFTHMIFYSIYTIIILKKPDHYGFDSFIISFICCILISIVLIKMKKHKNFKWLKVIIN
ncbi:acyltransferase family protein [Chishuiella sp.]|uniref:acyltransferase family protein n=1 Tax=Chishuiella sp. TaxID=1969467 RepID=UPI0028AF1446|nr:acyltransferase family protein [Chishuiella sp.]